MVSFAQSLTWFALPRRGVNYSRFYLTEKIMTDLFSSPDHTLDAQASLPGAGNDGT